MTQSYTKEMLDELRLCINDPNYFIIQVDPALEFTEKQLGTFDKNMIGDDGDIDADIFTCLYLTWYAMYHHDETIIIGSPTSQRVDFIARAILLAVDKVPDYLRPTIIKKTRNVIEFENGSKIFIDTYGDHFCRGMSCHKIYLNDLGSISYKKRWSMIETANWALLKGDKPDTLV